MKTIQIYLVDAFTNKAFGGNAAGVVPDATGLSDTEMQKIARELNQSETAFLIPQDEENHHQIRYFTPTSEIDFCGHATIASSWVLAKERNLVSQYSNVIFESNVGPIPVAWNLAVSGALETVVMRQVPPQVRNVDESTQDIAHAIGVNESDIDFRYPIRLAYTGNWNLLVPIKSRAAVDSARPNLTALAEMNRKQGAVGAHLFTFDTDSTAQHLYTRDFSPAVGIPEDPVTGSANGALAGYLVLEHILNRTETHHLQIGQGDAVGRPGTVYATIHPGETPDIHVGGAAVIVFRGQIDLASEN